MIASLSDIRKNPHCMQSIRQGGFYDLLVEKEGKSEHRHCYTDLDFSMEFDLDEENIPYNEYVDLKPLDATVLHWGQLKLLLGEIEFLTPYMGVEDLCVVYMGSAPGHHIKVLVDMMPKTWKWELYDDKPCEVFCEDKFEDIIMEKISSQPSKFKCEPEPEQTIDPELQELLDNKNFKEAFTKFKATHQKAIVSAMLKDKKKELDRKAKNQSDIVDQLRVMSVPRMSMHTNTQLLYRLQHTIPIAREHRPNVRTHLKYVTIAEAKELRAKYVSRPQTEGDPQLLCISDIRTPLERITETSVQFDMVMQKGLLEALGPYQASLKFKLPYSDKFPRLNYYLDGKLLYQPYSPRVSHECRLHTGKGVALSSTTQYDNDDYAKKLFHFQSTLRTSLYNTDDTLPNEADHPNLVSNGVGTDHCFDCTAARYIIRKYIEARCLEGTDVLKTLDDIVKQLITIQVACKADGNGTLDE